MRKYQGLEEEFKAALYEWELHVFSLRQRAHELDSNRQSTLAKIELYSETGSKLLITELAAAHVRRLVESETEIEFRPKKRKEKPGPGEGAA
jgi:hypothetical protein